MKPNNNIKNLSIMAGTALSLCMISGSAFAAETNPFGMTALKQGYQIAMNDSKAAEGSCGGAKDTMKAEEGKHDANKDKVKTEVKAKVKKEGQCGANKHK